MARWGKVFGAGVDSLGTAGLGRYLQLIEIMMKTMVSGNFSIKMTILSK